MKGFVGSNTSLSFADAHSLSPDGVMQDAVFDAFTSDTRQHEEKFQLWP